MGNPLEWIPEVKKEVFRIFEIFFWKIMDFQWKKWKLIKNGRKIPKKFKNFSRHNFLLFSSYEHIETRFGPFLSIFGPFSSFLGYLLRGPIQVVQTKKNLLFLAWATSWELKLNTCYKSTDVKVTKI